MNINLIKLYIFKNIYSYYYYYYNYVHMLVLQCCVSYMGKNKTKEKHACIVKKKDQSMLQKLFSNK